MPSNTDSRNRKIRDALFSAVFYTVLFIITAVFLLKLRQILSIGVFWKTVLMVSALWDLGMIVPMWISYQKRRMEIQGGEEDAAAQY